MKLNYINILLGLCCLLLAGCKFLTKPEIVTITNPVSTSIPYTISVTKSTTHPDVALQSFAFAEHDNKWLMLGGRKQGFHKTSTKASTFPTKYSNDSIFVYDQGTNRTYGIDIPLEHLTYLRATNHQYQQSGDVLYVIGGYGSNCTTGTPGERDEPSCYQTFPRLTAIKVPELITAIINGDNTTANEQIVSIEDERMRVTGGGLGQLGDNYYLVFGQDYDTIYMGGVTGQYTEEVRQFQINFDGTNLSIDNYVAYKDPSGITGAASQYHRRDLNVITTIDPRTAQPNITVYGGVFTSSGGGWVNPIYVNATSPSQADIIIDEDYQQKFCQYECASVLLYDKENSTMYTSLMGGISDYSYNKAGEMEPSNFQNNLPFVNTITSIIHFGDGSSIEYPQAPSAALPKLIGAEAEFIPNPALAKVNGEVIDFNQLPNRNTPILLGWMYGGIWATAPQSSDFDPTYAINEVYEVYFHRQPQN